MSDNARGWLYTVGAVIVLAVIAMIVGGWL